MIRVYWLFFVLMMTHPQIFGQLNESDSLRAVIRNEASSISQKNEARFELSQLFKNRNLDSAKYYIERVAVDSSNRDLWIRKKLLQGKIFSKSGLLDSAFQVYHPLLQIIDKERNPKRAVKLYGELGNVRFQQNRNAEALNYYLNAGEYLKETSQDLKRAINFLNIGNIYHRIGDYQQSTLFYERAIQIKSTRDNPEIVALLFNNIGINLRKSGQFEKAIASIKKGLNIYDSIGNIQKKTRLLGSLSTVYRALGEINQSRTFVDSAIRLSKINGIDGRLHYFYLKKGSLLIDIPDSVASGVSLCAKAYDAFTADLRNKRDACKCMALGYQRLNNFERSSHYFQQANRLSDTLNDRISRQIIDEVNTKYSVKELREKDSINYTQKIKINALESKAKDRALQNKNILLWFSFLLVAIIAITLTVVLRNYKRKKKDNKIITQQRKEILESIEYAQRIQQGILPSTDVLSELIDSFFILYLPKDIVAGDFYWFNNQLENNDTFFLAAADCTGHGVPGAMVSVICHNALNRSVEEYGLQHTNHILDKTKQIVIEELNHDHGEIVQDGMDIALLKFAGKDDHSISVEFSGANNPLYILREGTGQIEEIKGDKQPVGIYQDEKDFTSHAVTLAKNDRLFVFSDGYVDQFGGSKGKKLKSKPFKQLLLNNSNLPMELVKTEMANFFNEWQGDREQLDDVCLIGVEITESLIQKINKLKRK